MLCPFALIYAARNKRIKKEAIANWGHPLQHLPAFPFFAFAASR